MLRFFTTSWWVWLIKGSLLILFSLFCFFNPVTAMATMVLWLSLLMIADGAVTLLTTLANFKSKEERWALIAEGALSLLLGVLLFRAPLDAMLFLVMTAAIWNIFTGISRIGMAIQLRKELEGEGWLALSGVLAVAFGLALIAMPGIGLSTLAWMLGLFALTTGIILAALSFKVRNARKYISGQISDLRNSLQGMP